MLEVLGLSSLDELSDCTVPVEIQTQNGLAIDEPMGEARGTRCFSFDCQ